MAHKRGKGVDPTWPESGEDDHPVTELTADRQGALSPFGDIQFPLAGHQLPYKHPRTVINRSALTTDVPQ